MQPTIFNPANFESSGSVTLAYLQQYYSTRVTTNAELALKAPLTFTGADGTNGFTVPSALANAFYVKDSGTTYLSVDSTGGGLNIGKATVTGDLTMNIATKTATMLNTWTARLTAPVTAISSIAVSQAGTTVTTADELFSLSMVGGVIYWDTGQYAQITTYTDTTHVEVDINQTVAQGHAAYYYGGVQFTNRGNLGVGQGVFCSYVNSGYWENYTDPATGINIGTDSLGPVIISSSGEETRVTSSKFTATNLISVATPNNANATTAGVALHSLYRSTADPAVVYVRTA